MWLLRVKGNQRAVRSGESKGRERDHDRTTATSGLQAQWLDERLLEVIEGDARLEGNARGRTIFTQRPTILVGDYLQQVGQRINKVKAALLNLKFFERKRVARSHAETLQVIPTILSPSQTTAIALG